MMIIAEGFYEKKPCKSDVLVIFTGLYENGFFVECIHYISNLKKVVSFLRFSF